MDPDNRDAYRRIKEPPPEPEHRCVFIRPSGFPCGKPACAEATGGVWLCAPHIKTFGRLRLQRARYTPPLPGMPPPTPKSHGSPRQSGRKSPTQGGHAR